MSTALKGTMLTPGVSKNGRLYTPDLIRKAYKRLAQRLADGASPVTMLTHHNAGDDSTKIVGRVTNVSLNGDNLDYEALLADTPEAATIAALLTPEKPFLKNVSIRGRWLGEVQKVNGAETADDLEIDGLDFTKTPGVEGAVVSVAGAQPTESRGPLYITESASSELVFSETAPGQKPLHEMDADEFHAAVERTLVDRGRPHLTSPFWR